MLDQSDSRLSADYHGRRRGASECSGESFLTKCRVRCRCLSNSFRWARATLMVFVYLPLPCFCLFWRALHIHALRTVPGTSCAYVARLLIRILLIRVQTTSPRLHRRISGGSAIVRINSPTEFHMQLLTPKRYCLRFSHKWRASNSLLQLA